MRGFFPFIAYIIVGSIVFSTYNYYILGIDISFASVGVLKAFGFYVVAWFFGYTIMSAAEHLR